jgi:hypothetical protein
MSLAAACSAARPVGVVSATATTNRVGAPRRRGNPSVTIPSTSSKAFSNRRLHLTRTHASSDSAAEVVEPDGILDTAPAVLPVDVPEPPTPVSSSVAPPLACPVSLKLLDERGFAKSGLQYGKSEGIWDLTIGGGGLYSC